MPRCRAKGPHKGREGVNIRTDRQNRRRKLKPHQTPPLRNIPPRWAGYSQRHYSFALRTRIIKIRFPETAFSGKYPAGCARPDPFAQGTARRPLAKAFPCPLCVKSADFARARQRIRYSTLQACARVMEALGFSLPLLPERMPWATMVCMWLSAQSGTSFASLKPVSSAVAKPFS